MATYLLIAQELAEDQPETITVTPALYNLTQTPEMQVLLTYQRLQRLAKRKDRLMTLVYAFYLGELLENNPNRPHRRYLNSQVSSYYSLASRRTYNLFEQAGVEQIYRTKSVTLRQIGKLPSTEFYLLIGS